MLPLEIIKLVKEALTLVPEAVKLLSETVKLIKKIDSSIAHEKSVLHQKTKDEPKAYTKYSPAFTYPVKKEKQFMYTGGAHKLGSSPSNNNSNEEYKDINQKLKNFRYRK